MAQTVNIPDQGLNRRPRPWSAYGLPWVDYQIWWFAVCVVLWVVTVFVTSLLKKPLHGTWGIVLSWAMGEGAAMVGVAWVGWYVLREDRESVRLHQLLYLMARHRRVANGSGRFFRIDGHRITFTDNRIVHMHGPVVVHVPVPRMEPLSSATILGGRGRLESVGNGVMKRPDGRYIGRLDVRPLVTGSKSDEDLATLYEEMAALVRRFDGDRTIHITARNEPLDIEAVIALIDAKTTARNPVLRHSALLRRRWYRRVYGQGHAPNLTYRLTVAGNDVHAVESLMGDAETHLTRMGNGHARVTTALKDDVRRDLALGLDGGAGLWDVSYDGDLGRNMVVARVGEKERWARTYRLTSWPEKIFPERIAELGLLPFDSILSICATAINQAQGREILEGRADAMRADNAQAMSAQGYDNLTISASSHKVIRAFVAVDNGDDALVKVGYTLTVLADDPAVLERRCTDALAVLAHAKCGVSSCVGRQDKMLPQAMGLAYAPVAPLYGLSSTVGVLYPFNLASPGHKEPGHLIASSERANQLVFVNWAEAATGGLLIVGKQGYGKTVIAGLLEWETLMDGGWVTSLDPTPSRLGIAEVLGEDAVRLNLMAEGVAINLLTIAGAATDSRVLSIMAILKLVFGDGNSSYSWDPWEYDVLSRGMAGLIRHAALIRQEPRMGAFAAHLRHLERRERSPLTKAGRTPRNAVLADRYANLRRRLGSTYGTGVYRSLFDEKTSKDIDVPYVLINAGRLTAQEGVGSYLGFVVAQHVANMRAKRAGDRGIRCRLFIDESKKVMEYAAPWISRSGRDIRHDDLQVAIITQNPSDLMLNQLIIDTLSAINTRFFFNTQNTLLSAGGVGNKWLADEYGFTQAIIGRMGRLNRTSDFSECVMSVVLAAGDPRYGVIQVRVPTFLLYLLGSYKDEKDVRDRDRARYGSLWAAAVAYDDTANGEKMPEVAA